jgi:lipopolysaccharide export LptBFGC system permease protein LptF
LAKVTLLALVAFTLVLTVIAIIEPLRKQQGLAADQVLALFGYLLPVMLTMTLPVGAMLATTIVYGRFSQDNEFLACRASGISTLNLLRPAMVLGLIVTGCSVILSNFVAPNMVTGSRVAIENARGMAYRQLRSRSYLKEGSWIVHADYVDEQNDVLHGFVLADTKDENHIKIIAASKAAVNLSQAGDDLYIRWVGTNPVVLRTGSQIQVNEESQPGAMSLLNPLQVRAMMMDWSRMIQTLNSPYTYAGIARELTDIRREILHDNLARDVESSITQGRPYRGLIREQTLPGMAVVREQYVVSAPQAKLVSANDNRPDKFYVDLSSKGAQPVRVEVFRNGQMAEAYTGPTATIAATNSALTGDSQVNLSLRGPVVRTSPADRQPERRAGFEVGQLPIPKSVLDSVEPLTLEELFRNGASYTNDPHIQAAIKYVVTQETATILNEIKAEMHCRAAFSLSCFLLVSLGAALGLISRGGQFISAFAVGALPGIAVMLMIFEGRNMIENTKVASDSVGMAMIWGGIGILLAGTVLVYGRLIRR